MANLNYNYDLEERTAVFGEEIIKLCKGLQKDIISESIIRQLVRSSTSVGANYMEAIGASSRKDFMNKIFICKKEAQEGKRWLKMLSSSLPENAEALRKLWKESQELTLIFHKIASSTKKKIEN